MGKTLAHKIIEAHRAAGGAAAGDELELRVDQVLVHDGGGVLAFLQAEGMGVEQARTELAVCYVDHQASPAVFGSPDLPRILRAAADRLGAHFSGPGNGICHQVHAERFAAPGKVLLGADSHTLTAGGAGMLALGGTPIEASLALAGWPHRVRAPRVLGVRLAGRLPAWVGGKDVGLELLGRLGLRGAWGRVLEFHGPGVADLPMAARFTMANLCAELGALSAVFPSDERTRAFLRAQGREPDWKALASDADADYDETLELELDALEPLVAGPDRPDRVIPLREAPEVRIQQVCVGSCTNASAADLIRVAALLAGRRVHSEVSLVVVPGSRQALATLAASGGLEALAGAGARVLEAYCGPCIGAGEAPAAGSASLRSFSRNFPGRSGTSDARVYLAGPEACAAAALTGRLCDPREVAAGIAVPDEPAAYALDDALLWKPPPRGEKSSEDAPALPALPRLTPLGSVLRGVVLLRVGEGVTTDHIVPGGAQTQARVADIPALAQHAFATLDPEFPARARAQRGGFVVAGARYGMGSARAHAALVTVELGVRAVLARSIARAHRASLVAYGILPLGLASEQDYQSIRQGDELEIPGLPDALEVGRPLVLRNLTRGVQFAVSHGLDARELEIVKAGGLLARGAGTAAAGRAA